MTRKQVMTRLSELGIKDIECRYEEIKYFLQCNRVPLKEITNIRLSDNQTGSMEIFGEENWEVYIELGTYGEVEC